MTLTARQAMLLAAAGSVALLLGAFTFQAMGYAPCKLCLWQRWPHAAAVALGLAVLATARPAAVLGWAGALAAATTGGLGIYHTGVERGWWPGPDTCTSAPIGNVSAQELLNQIMTAPLVRCDEVAWSLLGLSMASWNALVSFGLAALWAWGALRAARD